MKATCLFREKIWRSGRKVTCFVDSATTNEGNKTVKFNLEDLGGRNSSEVQAIVFTNSSLPVFPSNLTMTFPNLAALDLANCGLTEITKADFTGLEGLKELDLQNNELQSLPTDLFCAMKKLKIIWLKNNRIQYLDSKIFDGMKKQIEVIDLRSNIKINDRWHKITDGRSIDDFMRMIETTCEKPANESKNNLWLTRQNSDFMIVVGEVELTVNKVVIAMQSKVFAAMFKNNWEEQQTNRMRISDFSSAAIEEFLIFVYTGKVQSELNAMELFSLAAKYDVAALEEISKEMILNNVDESNALEVLVLAILYDSEVLMKTSFEFVKRAYPEISFNESLMRKPHVVKTLVEAKQHYDLVVEEARKKREDAMVCAV